MSDITVLMHMSLTASIRIFGPLAISGVASLTYDFILAAILWVLVAAVALATGRQISHQPLPKPMA